MSENREEILANFQACTGIDDVALAIYHLDDSNWDLVRAVSGIIPSASQSLQIENSIPDMMIVKDINDPAIPVEDAYDSIPERKNSRYPILKKSTFLGENLSQPSTSREVPNKKKIKFNIKYNNKNASIFLQDTSSIHDLKLAIQKEFDVSPCRQLLAGWTNKSQNEDEPLSKLVLYDENNLDLHIDNTREGFDAEKGDEVTEKLNGTYNLNINCNDESFNLKFRGTTTILEVKTGIYALTNIEIRNQVWTGWPSDTNDQMLIALSGINFPDHEFSVNRSTRSFSNTREIEKKTTTSVIQIDSDDDEYEDASESFNVDDDYFAGEVTTIRTDPLIPDNIEDEIIGSLTFIERFTARYGPVHPAFFQGSLDEAMQGACNKPAKDRKILAIYLHHDSSVLANVFCTQLLGFESVMQMFEMNFILWGWDLTFESNFHKLQQSVTSTLGTVASMSLRNMPLDRLPAIFLIMRIRSSTDIFNVIHGNVGVNELLSGLIEAVEVFKGHQKIEIKEEEERAERELVKWEQDQAYRESLEADRAKEEAKRSKEEAEEKVKRKQLNEYAEEMRKKEEYRLEVEKGLPTEPPFGQGDKENVIQIRFRLPEGKHLERKFFTSTSLKVVLDFLIVEGYPSEEYKVISSWPRRDLTTLDQSITLQELKLYPQETVILEER